MDDTEPRLSRQLGSAYGRPAARPNKLLTEVTSDRGIMMRRRLLEQQIAVVAGGGDPVGVNFDPQQSLVKVRSGNFYRSARATG